MRKASIENVLDEASRIRTGFGMIYLSLNFRPLKPLLQQAIRQAGFVDITKDKFWFKIMPDGTRRALIIGATNSTKTVPPEAYLGYPVCSMLVAGGNESDAVTVVDVVKDDPTHDRYPLFPNEPITFNVPTDFNDGAVMGCEKLYTVESRYLDDFDDPLQHDIKLMPINRFATTKYLLITSPSQQTQLAYLIDQLSASFEPIIEKRVQVFRIQNNAPDDLSILEPLRRIGLEGDILFKAAFPGDGYMYHFVLLDMIGDFVSRWHQEIFHSLAPWFERNAPVHFGLIQLLYDFPCNAHLRPAMEYLTLLCKNGVYGLRARSLNSHH